MEILQLLLAQNGGNEQDGVRSPLDRFKNLPLIDDEILAQQRKFYRCANLFQMLEGALKKLLVGENGKATGAGGFVGARNTYGIEISANDAGRRRGLFHLGDQRH